MRHTSRKPASLAATLACLLLVASHASARAENFTFNERFRTSIIVGNDCNGEVVFVSGELHVLMHITIDADGSAHFADHSNFDGEGIGDRGNEYDVVVIDNDVSNISFDSATEATAQLRLLLIRRGAEDNFVAAGKVHFTVNSNGELTAEFADFEAECRG
jgi:hypothetical protein